jgi:hypothetical protein
MKPSYLAAHACRIPLARVAALVLVAVPGPAQDAVPEEGARGLVLRKEGAFDGYTLISPLNSDHVYLLGMDGEIAHEWTTSHAPGGGCYFENDGSLLRCSRIDENPRFHGGGIAGRLERIDWDGRVTWEYELSSDERTQHHDLKRLPNGNLLVICWEYLPPDDAIALGRDPRVVGPEGLWPDVLLEVRPIAPKGGEIVWEWHVWDHLVQDLDPAKAGYGSVRDHPERIDINGDHRDAPPPSEEELQRQAELAEEMRALGYAGGEDDEDEAKAEEPDRDPDWLHTNAIDYDPVHDFVLLSSPHMCEVWVIDHSTTTAEASASSGGRWGHGGDLLYRWGNPKLYGAGTESERWLDYQHNPTWLATGNPDELRILLFNNGMHREAEDSRVEELVLPFDPKRGFVRQPPAAFGPELPAWSYVDPKTFYSPYISGAQRLPNGNTLICAGVPGRVFEVTRAGEIVWEYLNPLGGDHPAPSQAGQAPRTALFRATRIAKDHPGLAGRDLAQR